MEILWFCIIAFMLAMYVILDGFDLGAGIIFLAAARSDQERRIILNAIGPVWDGNEVWLLAAGGTLYFSFPLLYASSFSGFYLPLMIVLWLLMLRGLGIEFRHRIHHPLWAAFWDAVFSFSSILLAIFFGAALGNVVRGVPLNQEGYFFEPLWTTFTVVPEAGILDWFTVLMGLVGLTSVTLHGANYLAMKCEGAVRTRARRFASLAWVGAVVTSIAALTATSSIRPGVWNNFAAAPWGILFPLAGLLGLVGTLIFSRKANDRLAFLSSAIFIGCMLATTAFGLFPYVLPASTDPHFSLTAYNTAASDYGLRIGLYWWIPGIILALGYLAYVVRSFRGKTKVQAEGEGY